MNFWKVTHPLVLALLAFAGVVLLLGCAVWTLRPQSYRFELRQTVADPDEVSDLVLLANRLDRIWNDYRSEFVSQDAINSLAYWIQKEGSESERWVELQRLESDKFTLINAMLDELAVIAPNTKPSDLADLEFQTLTEKLQDYFEGIEQSDKLKNCIRVLSEKKNVQLLRRIGAPSFPTKDAWFADRRQQRWINNFLAGVNRDLRPRYALYQVMQAAQPVKLVETETGSLLLIPLTKERDGVRGTRFDAENSTTDFEIYLESAIAKNESEQPGHANSFRIPTGVQTCLNWESKREGKGEIDWQPAWPPQPRHLSSQIGTAGDFLKSLGFPADFDLLSITGEANGTLASPKLKVKFTASSPEFPAWQHVGSLSLSEGDIRLHRQEMVGISQEMHNSLGEWLAQQNELAGSSAKITLKDGGEGIRADLQHSTLGEFSLDGWIDDYGSLRFEPLPKSIAQRRQIADAISHQTESLRGRANEIRLKSVELDLTNQRVKVAVGPADPAKTELAHQTWSDPVSRLPGSTPDVEPFAPEKLKSDETWVKAVNKVINEDYSDLSPMLEVVVLPREDSAAVSLGIALSDWPPIEVGPKVIESKSEIRAAIDSLLDESEVISAANQQWGAGEPFKHERYGKLRSRMTSWDANATEAEIANSFEFVGMTSIDWIESPELQGDEWSRLDEVKLADDLKTTVRSALLGAQSFLFPKMVEWSNGYAEPLKYFRLDLDDTGISTEYGNRWFALKPPRIALRADVRVPYLGIGGALKGIEISQDGVNMHASEVGLGDKTRTYSSPYFAVSEPMLFIGLRRASIRLEGILTPPLPIPVSPVNPWKSMVALKTSVGGVLENQSLNGSFDLSILRMEDICQGDLMLDFQRKQLRGMMQAKGRVPGFETVPLRFDGEVHGDADSRALSFKAVGEVLEYDAAEITLSVGGEHQYPYALTGEKDAHGYSLRGRVTVPWLGSISVAGGADKDLNRYLLQGEIPVVIGSYFLTLTEEHAMLEHRINGFPVWRTSAPEITLLEAPNEEGEGTEQVSTVSEAKPVAPSERETVENLDQPPPTELPDGAPRGPSYHTPAHSNLSFSRDEAGTLYVRDPDQNDRLIAKISRSDLPYPLADWEVAVWSSNGESQVMLIKKDALEAKVLTCGAGGAYRSTRSFNDVAQFTNSGRFEAELRSQALRRYFAAETICNRGVSTPGALTAAAEIGAIEFAIPLENYSHSLTRCVHSTGVFECFADLPSVKSYRNSSVFRSLTKHQPDDTERVPRLVACDPQEGNFGWALLDERFAESGMLALRGSSDSRDLPFTALPSLTPVEQATQMGLCCQSLWSEGLPGAKSVVFCEAGAVIETASGFHLVIDVDGAPLTITCQRQDFVEWEHESVRFLPDVWRTPQQRKDLSTQQLAEVISGARGSLTDRTKYPVNPLQLLITLSNSKSDNTPTNPANSL